MASSLICNTNQVYFASVLAMDNEFFQNDSVKDGQVISTVQGKLVEISEEVFARTFQLPVEGLMDLNEVLGTKKMIRSSYICPADGSQYYRSAVGLVFMEWAAGLAMETSKVGSAVHNQAEAKLNQLENDEPAETMTTSCKR
ncbi:hypothetical protein F511_42488 [Dorcoceras hygrometricum]|uniref:Uncharacterized protein n=1 Tax=Dorcoceras hygrometricum TaxID=472368 RepID=A0A2Z7CKX5_9LAMI|nr:hypothetical protein F511_42488 [Dorcoceras hygrometricum]